MAAYADRLDILGLSHSASAVAVAPALVDEAEYFSVPLSSIEVEKLYVYQQPKDFGDMNLANWFNEPWSHELLSSPDCKATQYLWRLNRTVERLVAALGSGADWAGIYRVVSHAGGGSLSLLKQAYRGSNSRGLFPLTEEFAQMSNNSNCALRRKAKVVDDTLTLNPDQPYYE